MNIKLLGLSLIGCLCLSGCAIKCDSMNDKKEHEYVKIKTNDFNYEFNVDGVSDTRILEQPTIKKVTKIVYSSIKVPKEKELKDKNNKSKNNKKDKKIEDSNIVVTDDTIVLNGKNVVMSYKKSEDDGVMALTIDSIIYDYDELKDINNTIVERHQLFLKKDVPFILKENDKFSGIIWYSK